MQQNKSTTCQQVIPLVPITTDNALPTFHWLEHRRYVQSASSKSCRFWSPYSVLFTVCLLAILLQTSSISFADAVPEKVTYDDHIKPVFREHCLSCHNSTDKKSGLSLDSFSSTMTGGSGGESLVAGDLDSSRLWALTAHVEQPKMPPNQDRIADSKLALLKSWIEQGMPENSGSTIKKPKVNLAAMGTVTQGRPEGSPPMPESMLKQTPLFTEKAAAVSALAASPWAPLVAVGGQNQVSLYHSESGNLLGVLPFAEGEPQSITFSRDGRAILVGGGHHSHSGYAVLYDIKTGNRIARVGDELDIVLAADLSEDNSKIAVAGPQKVVRIYETATGQLLHELKRHTDWIYALRFSPDGLLLATADRSNGLFVWETDTGRFYLDLLGHKNEIRTLVWRPDSSALISGSLDSTMKMWEMVEGKTIKSWDAHGGGVLAIATCNDGTLVSTGKDHQVKVWDGAGNAVSTLPGLADHGLEVAITVDSKQVVAGDWGGNVRLWERANPANEKQLRSNPLTLQRMIASAEQALSASQAAFDVVKAESDSIQARVVAMQQKIATFEVELSDDVKQIEANQSQTAIENGALAQDIALVNQLKQALTSDQAAVQEKGSSITAAQAAGTDASGLQSELDSLNKKVNDEQSLITSTEQQQAIRQSRLEKLAPQLALLKATKDARQNGLDVAKAEIDAMKNPIADTKSKLDTATNQLAWSQSRLDDARGNLSIFENTMKQLDEKRTAIRIQAELLVKQKNQAQVEIENKKASRDLIATKIAGLQNQIDELNKIIATENQLRLATEGDIKTQQESLESIQSQIDQFVVDQKAIEELVSSYK